jgi:hypothetical protein
MEPLTIGTVVVSALGLAGEAALKGAIGETVKDAYKALKSKVMLWSSSDVEALEKTPGSAARRAVVAEVIDARPEDEKAVAQELARQLIAALNKSGPIGLDVGRLDALAVRLGTITVTEGTGARIAEARVPGTFEVDAINVGSSGKK